MNLTKDIKNVYFLGIGGIGMSALARYFRHLGMQVAGYDHTSTLLTKSLQTEGISVHYHDLAGQVKQYTGTRGDTLVVYTPAVPGEHREMEWLRTNGFTILKRAQVLGMICNQAKCLAVAGTHGKTTVSTMTATILKNSGTGCGAFLGGISKNFGSNLLLPGPDNRWLVTEADEYDRSFLQLTPDIAVITYMDADHLDIYADREDMKESFIRFAGQIRPDGCLLVNKSLDGEFTLPPDRKIFTYTLSGDADFHAEELRMDHLTKCYSFKMRTPSGCTETIVMDYPGLLNVENAVAAGGAAYLAGARLQEIGKGLASYSGVLRRFDIRFRNEKVIFIDDYAHHPEELKAFISSVRLLYPEKRITGIFQPHLYSRTRDFASEFAQSLDLLDSAVILPVYPARELPIPGVTSELIYSRMDLRDKILAGKEEIERIIRRKKPEILLTMGAGDIDLLADELISILKDETNS